MKLNKDFTEQYPRAVSALAGARCIALDSCGDDPCGKERKYGYCPKCLIEVANVVTSGIISIRLAGESKNNILWQRKSPSSTYAAPVACVGSVIRICFRSMLPRAISLQPTPKQPPKIRI